METDPVLKEADEWFKKLNNPSHATYKIAHLHSSDSPPSTSSSMTSSISILEQYRATSERRMERLDEAVKILSQR